MVGNHSDRFHYMIDPQTRLRNEARQKAMHDYATAIETAKREGQIKERHAIARKMLMEGMGVRKVAKFVELSIEELETIQRELPQDSRGAVSTSRTR